MGLFQGAKNANCKSKSRKKQKQSVCFEIKNECPQNAEPEAQCECAKTEIQACCKPGCSPRMPCLSCAKSGVRVVIATKDCCKKQCAVMCEKPKDGCKNMKIKRVKRCSSDEACGDKRDVGCNEESEDDEKPITRKPSECPPPMSEVVHEVPCEPLESASPAPCRKIKSCPCNSCKTENPRESNKCSKSAVCTRKRPCCRPNCPKPFCTKNNGAEGCKTKEKCPCGKTECKCCKSKSEKIVICTEKNPCCVPNCSKPYCSPDFDNCPGKCSVMEPCGNIECSSCSPRYLPEYCDTNATDIPVACLPPAQYFSTNFTKCWPPTSNTLPTPCPCGLSNCPNSVTFFQQTFQSAPCLRKPFMQ